ncbi:putative RING-H2 finger protein ATL49 [Nymphaea colorata]|uniref:RING-type E3 ubiquitin transferase n=1 Tax=Nymphaea colorata TaxID=210225 RepID=A0A5K1CTN8_9MAGN|nr:putative RING-H2 finger protein ATL49 [Nymphaea colorata]
MSWVLNGSRRNESSYPSPFMQYFLGPPPPSPPPRYDQSFENKISPSILLIIIILAVIFFISGLLHLLVRFLIRPSRRDSNDMDNVTVLQGQLQQLFHLHDAGVDQSYIDTLPVFLYKSIIGAKNPFDCAVCLCEFEPDDKLRLLPKCSHAFHLECIDTWLLSHSTCPLCRGSLLPDFPSNTCSPVVLVLESGSESSREIVDRDFRDSLSAAPTNLASEDGFPPALVENSQKPVDNPAREEAKVVPVKLGKLRNTDAVGGTVAGDVSARGIGAGESSSSISNVDSRRCYSMGSFEYVLDEASLLQVPIVPVKRKRPTTTAPLPLVPGHRPTVSMCDFSKNSQPRKEGFRIADCHGGSSAVIREDKKESFSVSKIWLRTKKDKPSSSTDPSRRAFSFRLPMQRVDDAKLKQSSSQRTTVSEIEVEGWMNHGDACSLPRSSVCGVDEESCSFYSVESQISSTPSFAKRTLNWIVGKQNRVMHSAPIPPV